MSTTMPDDAFAGEFDRIGSLLDASGRILVLGHIDPDGDCIGSMFAIALFLDARGKKVCCHAPGSLRERYRGLPGARFLAGEETLAGFDPDLVIAVDAPTTERFNGIARPGGPVAIINIDHHPTNETYGDIDVVDPGAAAAAIIVCRLLEHLAPEEITPGIADCLYLGILLDTGGFRFQNTDAEALATAARLVCFGARPYELAHEFIFMKSYVALRLLAKVLDSIESHAGGRIAVMSITRRMLEESGAAIEDSEGFVDYAAAIDDVELAALLRENGPGEIRASLRSRAGHDVARLAARFGGGGHSKAAGLTICAPLDEARRLVVEGLGALLAEGNGE
ncbi:MAG: bifunctional oligoribonuclease/PAP phosphatase NrnA [Candidatus Krumholzibacteriota bacterium]|nr:bifunctional oligoribonuclease/PAP phosphatase NrnA [Candidatus Krumholzibacteriota bacterium]